MRTSTKKLTFAAIMAALTFIATRFTQFPIGALGYVHAGDALVLLCAFVPGGGYGVAAAGIGSMLADLTSGYAIYALPTLIIKALMCLSVLLITDKAKPLGIRTVLGMICGAIVMMLGYFVFDYFFMGYRELAVLQMIFASWTQALFGCVAAYLLLVALVKAKALKFFK